MGIILSSTIYCLCLPTSEALKLRKAATLPASYFYDFVLWSHHENWANEHKLTNAIMYNYIMLLIMRSSPFYHFSPLEWHYIQQFPSFHFQLFLINRDHQFIFFCPFSAKNLQNASSFVFFVFYKSTYCFLPNQTRQLCHFYKYTNFTIHPSALGGLGCILDK